MRLQVVKREFRSMLTRRDSSKQSIANRYERERGTAIERLCVRIEYLLVRVAAARYRKP